MCTIERGPHRRCRAERLVCVEPEEGQPIIHMGSGCESSHLDGDGRHALQIHTQRHCDITLSARAGRRTLHDRYKITQLLTLQHGVLFVLAPPRLSIAESAASFTTPSSRIAASCPRRSSRSDITCDSVELIVFWAWFSSILCILESLSMLRSSPSSSSIVKTPSAPSKSTA